ncbi:MULTISPECIES: DciA family protein [Salinicola]|uniref:RNA-binding protein n=1 Tax=Salinicola socius TaxID=404433 RepID=A0A1Q8SQT2_9GAMM|nr:MULTISPECIES: DciA family protein [Salinicola]OLO03764.1 hypothetical protein BTW07_12805 [Salinicola socius]
MSIKAKRLRAQPVSRLLTQPGGLGDVMRMATLIERAQSHLRHQLPPDVAEHIYVGGYHDGVLTLITDRAAWLTWLRYEQPRLLKLLHQLPGFEAVMKFSLKVRPIRPVKAIPRQTRRLSQAGAEALSDCAEGLEESPLKRSLNRLASHAHAPPETGSDSSS